MGGHRMSWMRKTADSDIVRIKHNILRLENLKDKVHDLAYFATASQGGGHLVLESLLDDRLVLGRPKVYNKLKEALTGENNQKIALDAPSRFARIMFEAEVLVGSELAKEKKSLRNL